MEPEGVQTWYVDDSLLVLEKPPGLLSVPGRGPGKQDCLSARAQRAWPDALVVHRLDMATSGLMLMARSPATQRTLSAAFARREVHKRYIALVCGRMPASDQAWAQIDLPLTLDWPNRPLSVVDFERGKPSLTRWRLAPHPHGARAQTETGLNPTRLELEPLTGRSHQLRVHLQALGHPILGDRLYDPDAAADVPRLMLHAWQLGLAHPTTGLSLHFESPPPF